jgi:serine/threonine-protein kinase
MSLPVTRPDELPPPEEGTRHLPPGTLLAGRYRIVGMLGHGAMGEVYRADDLTLGQPVALKFLPAPLAHDPDRLARFRHEVARARRVSHPNVSRVYDIGEADGRTFLSMEFIDGEDLAALLTRVGRLPEEKAVEVARQLCSALAAVHDQGLLHRDLKPANVMLDGRGKVRLADFGLVAVAGEAKDVRSGTPAYQAPEQLAGREVTARSDLFALGLVLYEVFTGKRAFVAPSREELARLYAEGSPLKPSSHVSGLNPQVEGVILSCLERDPKNRPPSAYEVLRSLPGDPLEDARKRGETPLPDDVRNVPEEGTLTPVRAAIGLGAVFVALAAFLALVNNVTLVGKVGLPEHTEVLAKEAEEVIKSADYPVERDPVFGFDHDQSWLAWVNKQDPTPARWEQAKLRPAAPIYFWYRQSPQPLVPNLYYPYPGSIEVSRITWDDPPPLAPGMVAVRLDTAGKLLQFLAVPPEQTPDGHAPPKEPDWGPFFHAAGLKVPVPPTSQLAPTEMPAVVADKQFRWDEVPIHDSETKVRVEAASYRGRPVAFQVVGEWRLTEHAGTEAPHGIGCQDSQQAYLFLLVLIGTVVLAPHSLRAGRYDDRGASRLAVLVFAIQMVVWVVETHHVGWWAELRLFVFGLAFALYWAGLIAFSYLVLEPYVRRYWTETVISWTRLLGGRWRDPMVGRDVLAGVLGGVLWTLVAQLGTLVPARLGDPAPMPWWDWWAPNTLVGGYWVGNFLINLVYAFRTAFFFNLLFLVLLRVLTRNAWLAGGLYVLLWTGGTLVEAGATSPSWLWLFVALNQLLFLGLLLRFGALAIITASFVIYTLWFPMTLDLSAWYTSGGLCALGAVAALAVFGFVTSRGRRSAQGPAAA